MQKWKGRMSSPITTCSLTLDLQGRQDLRNITQKSHGRIATPVYNKCCKEGSIVLLPYKPPPEPLFGLLTGKDPALSRHFFDNIRRYPTMWSLPLKTQTCLTMYLYQDVTGKFSCATMKRKSYPATCTYLRVQIFPILYKTQNAYILLCLII